MVLNKQCLTCNTKFSYCPDCSRADALKPAWASQFCSESCATLWSTLTKFGMDRLTKSEAKSIISDLDLKPVESYSACVQRDMAKVMTEDKKSKRGKRIEIEPVDEVIDIETEMVESIIEQLNPAQPIEEVAESHEVVIEKENE